MLPTGMFSAAASLGLSLLWDTDVGLSHIDKYAYASEDHIKVRLLRAGDLSVVLLTHDSAHRLVRCSRTVSFIRECEQRWTPRSPCCQNTSRLRMRSCESLPSSGASAIRQWLQFAG